jgi:hypothetical protein
MINKRSFRLADELLSVSVMTPRGWLAAERRRQPQRLRAAALADLPADRGPI